MDNIEVQIKVVILGNPAVGKSSILRRFVLGECSLDSENTIGAKFMGKILNIDNRVVKLNIWDTAGQERYQSFSKLYCRDAGAAILVFDLTDPTSFFGMQNWYDIMSKDILPAETQLFVVGNKCDLSTAEPEFDEQVKIYSDSIKAECFKVSAMSGVGIEELFERLSKKYIDNIRYEKRNSIYLTRQNSVKSGQKKKRFC